MYYCEKKLISKMCSCPTFLLFKSMSKLQHLVKSDLLGLTYLDDFIGFHYNYKNIYLRKYNDGEL